MGGGRGLDGEGRVRGGLENYFFILIERSDIVCFRMEAVERERLNCVVDDQRLIKEAEWRKREGS